MPDINTVRAWEGRTMVDRDGNPIGSINAIYLDDQTGQPEWALVNTGLFGTKSTFVPLAQAAQTGENVQVPYDKRLSRTLQGWSWTGTCRRLRGGSCGATTASTTTPPIVMPPAMTSHPAVAEWGETWPGGRLTTP
jgi:PRC-barrel domain protein